jgi:N-acetylglucosamine kinase-like BadF-type ATPase
MSLALVYPNLVIGIDGGGSHTIAFLAERAEGGRILGRGEAGPSNAQALGVERAVAALDQAIARAFAAANLQPGTVAGAGLGLAGVDLAESATAIYRWCDRIQIAKHVQVDNDATLLLEAGTPEGWGLAVIAGTGSIAFARAPDRRFDRSGGWGYLLGDEGSAYALALAGMRAVARASDQCLSPTILTEKILAFMRLKEPLEMIQAVYLGEWDRARIASIAPLVLDACDAGDAIAVSIVQTETMELARTTVAAARKLSLPLNRTPLAVTGGVILNGVGYRERFLAALGSQGLTPDPVTLVHEPANGAVRVARRIASP